MPPTIDGLQIVFGIDASDAPTGVTGFVCRSADLREEPEVVAFATDGYGAVEAAAVSKKEKRVIMASFTGYIDKDSFDAKATAQSGILVYKTRNYFVKSVSRPRRKGEFTEVTLECEHLPLVINS